MYYQPYANLDDLCSDLILLLLLQNVLYIDVPRICVV